MHETIGHRFHVQIDIRNPVHVWFRLWVNGGLCGTKSWCMRIDEFDTFIRRLEPEKVTEP